MKARILGWRRHGLREQAGASMKTKTKPIAVMNRREFLQSTAKAGVALSVLSAAPFVARGRVLGANDRIGIGFIGVGGRGSSHVGTVQRLIKAGENAQIVAVNDVTATA